MNIFDAIMESTIDFSSPEDLYRWMSKNIRYSEYTKLKSYEEFLKSKSGSCHDQVMFELRELRKMGKKPNAIFFIEYNPDKPGGGMTHSFVYYHESSYVIWFEHAWGDMKGLHKFASLKDIKNKIRSMHVNNEFGNHRKYPNLLFKSFGSHNSGETLGEFVSKILN